MVPPARPYPHSSDTILLRVSTMVARIWTPLQSRRESPHLSASISPPPIPPDAKKTSNSIRLSSSYAALFLPYLQLDRDRKVRFTLSDTQRVPSKWTRGRCGPWHVQGPIGGIHVGWLTSATILYILFCTTYSLSLSTCTANSSGLWGTPSGGCHLTRTWWASTASLRLFPWLNRTNVISHVARNALLLTKFWSEHNYRCATHQCYHDAEQPSAIESTVGLIRQ